MGLLDRIFGADKMIKVHFIDNRNGQTICISRMKADQLPKSFSVPTTMHIYETDWTVEQAIPENAADFIKSRNLLLKVRKIEKFNAADIWYSIPTTSNEFPRTSAVQGKADFAIQIHEDDYRQKEFLKRSAKPKIEAEFIGIRNIRDNHSKKSGDYILYKNCHIRSEIGTPGLSIDFNALSSLLSCASIGQVIINGEALSNGFAIKTPYTTFFGLMEQDIVTELCVSDWTKDSIQEINEVNKAYGLLFVNWCHCDIIDHV